jgi:predicted glycosyltransferase
VPQANIWQIYALGGGWGHLNRALSLARVAANSSLVRIVTNSPYVNYLTSIITKENSQIGVQSISPEANLSETRTQVLNTLLKRDYDCLIIDTFPRGLGGELVDVLPQLINIPRVLIHRDLNPDYVAAKNLQQFVVEHYNLLIVPGDGENLPFSHLPKVRQTPPWLMRSSSELQLEKAYSYLRLNFPQDKDRKVILAYSSGNLSELDLFGLLTRRLVQKFPTAHIRCLAPICPSHCPPDLWVSHAPGMDCLPPVDLVIGGGGYNTVSECLSLQISLVALAYPRLYDRQIERLQRWRFPFHPVSQDVEADVEAIVEKVQTCLELPKPELCLDYVNGAAIAFQIISEFLNYN